MSVAVQTISLHSPSPVSSVGLPLQEDDDALGQLRSQHQRAFPKRPAPTFTLGGRPQPRVSTSAAPRSNRTSFFISARSNALATVCSDPKILTCLLSSLTFQDFRSLNATSKAIRRIFLDAPIKDVVFARFIPGYRAALRWRDSRMWEDTFRLNYTDLSLLVASLNTPLHRYPMHALTVLSSDLPTWEQIETTKRLQAYSRMHSRAVLHLQNMVHSSSHAGPSDLDNFQSRPNVSRSHTNLRELKFPAPLSYPGMNNANGSGIGIAESQSLPPSLRRNLPNMSRSTTSLLGSLSPKNRKRHGRQNSESAVMESKRPFPQPRQRTASKLSIFNGSAQRAPLPEPASEPASLRLYSGSWRSSYYGAYDDAVLRPPKRRFASSRIASHSSSSLGSASNSPASSSRGHNAAATPPLSGNTLHDLAAASKRERAPILRVFVPCSTFNDNVVTACEDQLIEADLWDNLSVGDVVCNLGYVPLVDETQENGNSEKDHRLWLVFTGDQLAIYHPSRPPPIAGSLSLSLPSPFYYSHILPSNTNPRLCLTLPTLRASFSLSSVTSNVVTPHSPGGYARVKTHAWLTSLDANRYCAPSSVMNAGWIGEWILQGEGTPEGRVSLQKALQGGRETECEYEIDLEKSGNGRLWLRMLTSPNVEQSKDTMSLRTQPTD